MLSLFFNCFHCFSMAFHDFHCFQLFSWSVNQIFLINASMDFPQKMSSVPRLTRDVQGSEQLARGYAFSHDPDAVRARGAAAASAFRANISASRASFEARFPVSRVLLK